MIIILEGPDGSGKTTYAHELAAHFKFPIAHEGPPPQDIHPIKYYSDVLEQRRAESRDWILDRFAFGERIYGPWYRGKDGLGDIGWDIIKNQLSRPRYTDEEQLWLHVLCFPPYDRCHAAWSSGREELIKDEKVFKETYRAYLNHCTNFDMIVDYTAPETYQALVNRIEDMLHPIDDIPF